LSPDFLLVPSGETKETDQCQRDCVREKESVTPPWAALMLQETLLHRFKTIFHETKEKAVMASIAENRRKEC